MHFKTFSIFVFLLLPFTISKYENIDPSMEGLADVLLCIDIQYTGLSNKKAGFDGLRKFLKSTALHKLVHAQNTAGEDEYYKGNRLAVVKMDDKGFDVLMHFNEPSPISKLSTIADDHFKNEQNQAAPREILLNDLFDDIRQAVFAPENGDRTAPDVMIYFYLPSHPSEKAFHEDLLRYGVDGSVMCSTYNVERDLIPAYLRSYAGSVDTSFDFVSSDGSDQKGLHIVVETQLQQCKNRSMYKYTKCSSMSSTNGARCIRRKVFKGDAIFPHLCWHGESPILEPCEKENECNETCDKYLKDVFPCSAKCDSPGKLKKTYHKNPMNCVDTVEDCFRSCGTTEAAIAGSIADAGTSGVVAGTSTILKNPDCPPGRATSAPCTELPEWAKGAIIAACVTGGLAFLWVVALSVRMAVRRAKARREGKEKRKPEKKWKGEGRAASRDHRGGTGRKRGRRGPSRRSDSGSSLDSSRR